jgi:hypothetical protein
MSALGHCLHRTLVKVSAVAKVQVSGAPERCQAQRDCRGRDPGRAE